MFSHLIAFFAGIVQLSHSGFQVSYALSQGSKKDSIAPILFSLLFCTFNVLFGFDFSGTKVLFGISVLIATAFFYLTFLPIIDRNGSRNIYKLLLLALGAITTIALCVIFQLGFEFGVRASSLQIPVILSFYFVTGTCLMMVEKYRIDTNRLLLAFRGGFVLGFLILVAISFSLEDSSSAYLLSMNSFFLAFVLDNWRPNRVPLVDNETVCKATSDSGSEDEQRSTSANLELEELIPRIEDYGLTKTELEVARLYISGMDAQEVSTALEKNIKTVYSHSKNMYRKTNTVDRTSFVLRFGKSK